MHNITTVISKYEKDVIKILDALDAKKNLNPEQSRLDLRKIIQDVYDLISRSNISRGDYFEIQAFLNSTRGLLRIYFRDYISLPFITAPRIAQKSSTINVFLTIPTSTSDAKFEFISLGEILDTSNQPCDYFALPLHIKNEKTPHVNLDHFDLEKKPKQKWKEDFKGLCQDQYTIPKLSTHRDTFCEHYIHHCHLMPEKNCYLQ
ncbi:MAG: hypothetical protein OEY01_11475 [Desulfobulbaceae bacterium]|nr:hypothetical protein [Desulfobulbaceae bacterium]HIJ79472.1 hypothetical protein [Deltaproteobacteria bacterium]